MVTDLCRTYKQPFRQVAKLEAGFKTQLLLGSQALVARAEVVGRPVLQLAVVAAEHEANTVVNEERCMKAHR